MPALLPNKFMLSEHESYPDDSSDKEVWIQAQGLSYKGYGDRHVLIYFCNSGGEVPFWQIIQLSGQASNYAYYSPVVQKHSMESMKDVNMNISLGTMTRAQRDQMLALAEAIKFNPKSTVNGCRVWTRDLLSAMVAAGLITQEKFEEIDKAIPLVKRVPEV
ncbi:hypothetical protein D9613_003338 [Agrocybe pediades]|uniref:Uncharacterized protein n=1 Tax=Agrocybe pediades TaxID=84607 RepID=A0A8H4QPI9_9AGAR|nr:hypothetical protein D9613_003338 [Agrocybe pediades]